MSEASEIKLDGREVNVTHGPSSLEKWMFSKYPAMWEKIDRRINPSKYHQVTDVDLLLGNGSAELPAETFKKMADVHRDECDLEVTQWLMDNDRPRAVAGDEGLHHLIKKVQVLPGLYQMPNDHNLVRAFKRQGSKGEDVAREWIKKAKFEGRKISVAGDIRTDGDLSILLVMGYVIFDGFIWSRQVLAVVEFSKLSHTGLQIKRTTYKALKDVGMEDCTDEVWRKVSDAGSNIKKGWNGFDGGDQTCADHKLERSTLLYTDEPEIGAMSRKRHESATHMKYSTVSANNVSDSQALFYAPGNKAVRSNATRWRSHHAESRWFRQHAVDMADAKHMSGNEVLEEKLLSAFEQQLNDEEEANLAVAARVSLALEPDTEPTISLVLPYIDSILYNMNPNQDVHMIGGGIKKNDELLRASQKARETVYKDFKRRWVEEIDEDYLATLKVASFCDPRHKAFRFRHMNRAARSAFFRDATRLAKELYDEEYAPKSAANSPTVINNSSEAAAVDNAPPTPNDTMKKQYNVDVLGLLGREDDDETEEMEEEDEWEQYLKLPQISATTDLLTWWRQNECNFPHVAKMAKQVLGCPACSSGVERMFSKAGRNHTDLQANMKEHSMRSILFAYNCSRSINRKPTKLQ